MFQLQTKASDLMSKFLNSFRILWGTPVSWNYWTALNMIHLVKAMAVNIHTLIFINLRSFLFALLLLSLVFACLHATCRSNTCKFIRVLLALRLILIFFNCSCRFHWKYLRFMCKEKLCIVSNIHNEKNEVNGWECLCGLLCHESAFYSDEEFLAFTVWIWTHFTHTNKSCDGRHSQLMMRYLSRNVLKRSGRCPYLYFHEQIEATLTVTQSNNLFPHHTQVSLRKIYFI